MLKREPAHDLTRALARCYIGTMKRRDPQTTARDVPGRASSLDPLVEALLAMRSGPELRAFLSDLCTPAELEAIADRWRVVPLLLDGLAYREIHDRTGVSVTTIGRIARCLDLGAGGYRLAANRVLGGHASGRADERAGDTGSDHANETGNEPADLGRSAHRGAPHR
jgi:TrpR-related protein YerC/YecD